MKQFDTEIFRLAIPNIISNISVPLLSTVDTALMGRLSESHIGAVGVASMIFNFIYWNFGFLRMGTTGMTAQAFGRNDKPDAITFLGRASMVALIIALCLLIFQYPIGQSGIYLMKSDTVLSPLIAEYFYIRIWAAPATLMLYVFMGWFFGMQNAILPLVLTIIINVVNILLSYYFVYQLDWDINGVAWGTVIAQYLGVVMAGIFFLVKYGALKKFFDLSKIVKKDAFQLFLRLNGDIFLRTLFLTIAFAFFYAQSSSFSTEILAVNVILLQFINWMSYGIDGFAFAAESLVGKYFGAHKLDFLRISINRNFFWSAVMAIAITALYFVFNEPLLKIFTDQESLILAAKPYVIWVMVFPICAFACYIWDGIYVGLTATIAMRNAMAIAFGVYLLAYLLLKPAFGNHGLWASLLIFMLARGAIQWWFFRRQKFSIV